MNWNKDKSLTLSRVCVAVFGLLLAELDLGGYWLAGWYARLRAMPQQTGLGILAAFYVCSVFGWLCLARLWKLLGNLKRGRVFISDNVGLLRAVSWDCVGVFLACAAACPVYLPLSFVSLAAGFMALIVRIVKNVFQQAIAMKDELDLTI